MSGPNGSSKSSDVAFNGTENPLASDGTLQTGGFSDVASPNTSINDTIEVLQGVPAQTKIRIAGDGVKQVGAFHQSSVQIALSDGTRQLSAEVGYIDSSRRFQVVPTSGKVIWQSRQRHVATIDSNGLLTLVGKGSTTIEARYSRQANSSFAGATPSATESVAQYATLDLVVTE